MAEIVGGCCTDPSLGADFFRLDAGRAGQRSNSLSCPGAGFPLVNPACRERFGRPLPGRFIMGEARSLTALSESDYEVIESAVMETSRGRWFMAEYARRNRQSDTSQLLTAIHRIERVVSSGLAPTSGSDTGAPEVDLGEAVALIADLRLDLERISGRGGEPSSGLAARIEQAAGSVAAATESLQEAAWRLREAGADEAACDILDKRATEIHSATAVIEHAALQVAKIADTIAMLDSSLRAICDSAHGTGNPAEPPDFGLAGAPPGNRDTVEIVEIGGAAPVLLSEARRAASRPLPELKEHPSMLLGDDIVFEEIDVPADPLQAPHVVAAATSEADLRAIDALEAGPKLAYFA